MTDLLSAASLLLTALTIIYGLSYPKMVEMLETIPPTHFVLVTCLLGLLTVHLFALTKQLFNLSAKLNPD